MKYTYEQRLNMALHGVDPDVLENPKQKLPPVKLRLEKLKRKAESGGPKAKEYNRKAEVYKVLLHPEQAKKRSLWNSLWGGSKWLTQKSQTQKQSPLVML